MTRSQSARIAFRLTNLEHEIITWAAKVSELTVSEFVRGSALDRASLVLVDSKQATEE